MQLSSFAIRKLISAMCEHVSCKPFFPHLQPPFYIHPFLAISLMYRGKRDLFISRTHEVSCAHNWINFFEETVCLFSTGCRCNKSNRWSKCGERFKMAVGGLKSRKCVGEGVTPPAFILVWDFLGKSCFLRFSCIFIMLGK